MQIHYLLHVTWLKALSMRCDCVSCSREHSFAGHLRRRDGKVSQSDFCDTRVECSSLCFPVLQTVILPGDQGLIKVPLNLFTLGSVITVIVLS